MAAITMAAATVFTLAPVVRQGPSNYAQHMRLWFSHISRGMLEANPSSGVLGEESVQNISLRPALARFLMFLPVNHLGRLKHPWYIEFLDLSPALAGVLVRAVLVLVLMGLVWVFRRPAYQRGHPEVLWEAAGVSILVLLYSPITWSQHCVSVIPAFYLIARTAMRDRGLDGWTTAALSSYVFLMLAQSRDLWGRDFSLLLDSYHVTTWALIAVLGAALRYRARVARGWVTISG